MARATQVALAALCSIACTSAAEAAAPRVEWRTVVTPRFRVHYHEGTEALARQVAGWAEPTLDMLAAYLDHVPSVPIHVVITDETDSPNGFAEVLPMNVVTLFAAVPHPFSTLGDYDDFMRLLFVHELTHVVHLDTISGLPAWVNAVVGKQWAPNLIQPSWFIEGVAVYAESTFTAGGRNRSAYIDMLVREQTLGDQFPDLSVLSHYTRRFPGGNFPWFLGGRFVDFIARRHGVEALAAMSVDYGGRALPYGVNLVSSRATGETLVEMYEAFQAEERVKTDALVARVRAAGEVEGARVMRPSPLVTFPRFSPRGDLAIVEAPRDDDQTLVIVAPDGVTERARLRTSDGRGAFTPDASRYVATVSDVFHQVFSYSDLELIEIDTGTRRRLTHGARLSAPDVAPDGRTVVAVQQGAGRTALVLLSLDDPDALRTLTALADRQVYDPRFSPDGRHVVASVSEPGTAARQLWRFDVASGAHEALTGAGEQSAAWARHVGPAYSADGAWVYFAADVDGVYDLHRVAVATGEVERLTRVLTGAFTPAPRPGSEEVLYVQGEVDGWSLRRLVPEPLAQGATPLRPAVTATVSTETYRDEAYAVWESLLPQAYLPSWSDDGVGQVVGISLSGTDAVKIHAYSLNLRYGLTSKRLGYAFNYSNRQTFASFGFSSNLYTTTRPFSFAARLSTEDRLESIFTARLSVTFPLSRWDTGHSVSVSYGVELRRGVDLPGYDVYDDPPQGLGDLNLASLGVSWYYSQTRGFAESYGAAAGNSFDVGVRLHDPRIGSAVRVVDITGHVRQYLSIPGLEHHVLALRLGFGGAAGDPAGRAVYALGGLPVRDVFSDALNNLGVGSDVIRGYPVASLRGNAFYLFNAEYRVPLWAIYQGVATLPFYLDRLSAAVFCDAGDTPVGTLRPQDIKVGVGGELRLDLSVAYYRGLNVRFGYGRGLMEEGIHNVYLVLGGVY
ncbi:MAG: PD40 domain-containing protein [Myxococcales bacterium]|nr:PD40 domain-containing protein [Myxococcales bacterium]MCB9646335.1 PD40 domain-containing protein [Deltaproteobacteria bacterium]